MAFLSFALIGSLGLAARADGRANLKFGAHAPPAPIENLDALTQLEESIGHEADILSIYQGWGNGGWAAVQPEWLQRASGDGRRDVLVTWEPWVAGRAWNQPNYNLATIVGGSHDDYIRSWAQGLRDHGRVIYLRPMHEMNGHWYPWAGGIPGNTPELYIKAWRHMHRIFAEEGAANVRWVWSPMAYKDEPKSLRFEKFYPGKDVVDVLALDGYNWGTREDGWGGWRSFDTVFYRAYRRLMKIGPQPIWFAEVGSADEGGSKARWVREMFRRASSNRYSRLTAVVWFNIDKERDWRATSTARVSRAFNVGLRGVETRRARLRASQLRRNSRSVDQVVRARRTAASGVRSKRPQFVSLFETGSPR